jgi:hypothetical protein
MPLYPQSVASEGARPTPSPSIVFTFGFVVESIKELRGASTNVIRR